MEKKKGMHSGRPKQAVRQEKFLGFFVTRIKFFIIQQKAKRAGVNMSDYLRQVAIKGEVKMRWTEAERQVFKDLVGMSNDLHRCVQIAEQEGALHAVLYFTRYQEGMDKALKRLEREP